jgi:enamine deaminase RidA (YjgF/YER057c/UK114 family)
LREAQDWIGLAEAPFGTQARAVYDLLEASLVDSGGLSALVRQHMYQRDKRRFPVLEAIRQERELSGVAPSSGLGLTALRNDDVNYEIDGIALSPEGRLQLGERTVLDAPGVGDPAALYSQAVAAGPFIFTAGMLALSADNTWAVTSFDDITEEGRWLRRGRSHPDYRMGPVVSQTWTLYERFSAFLRAYDLSLSQVANATIFLHDDGDFADALRVHASWFGLEGPAVQVNLVDEVGHKGSVIEIEITAIRTSLYRAASPDGVPPPVVQAEDLFFTSDHLPVTGDGRILWIDSLPGYIQQETDLARIISELTPERHLLAAQTWAALRSLAESVRFAGLDTNSLGQITVRYVHDSLRGLPWLDGMMRLVLGEANRAVVLLAVPSIPHSMYARVSVAGVGFQTTRP